MLAISIPFDLVFQERDVVERHFSRECCKRMDASAKYCSQCRSELVVKTTEWIKRPGWEKVADWEPSVYGSREKFTVCNLEHDNSAWRHENRLVLPLVGVHFSQWDAEPSFDADGGFIQPKSYELDSDCLEPDEVKGAFEYWERVLVKLGIPKEEVILIIS